MIHSITVTNYRGDSLKMELTRPQDSGFIIEKVTGLGPGKANINTSEVSTNDGAIYNSARVPSRNIVISVKYLFKETIEEARQTSYKYFPLKRKVTLLIETDNRMAEIEGYVESNEPDIFSQEEGSDISIICPNPFFYDALSTTETSFSGIVPAFEFPFSNESLTEPLLEFSVIEDVTDRVIDYKGDAEVGVTISIQARGEAGDITIYNVDTAETMVVYNNLIESLTGSGIVDGDEIIICTVRGQKSAKLIRQGKTTNILNCIGRDADWFQLAQGPNTFAYDAVTGRNNLRVVITNRIIYEGI